MRLGDNPNERNFPTTEAVFEESFVAMGCMHFPNSESAAETFSSLLLDDWVENGRPLVDWKPNEILSILGRDCRKRVSKGFSAGLVAHYLVELVAAAHLGSPKAPTPSLNKAAFLAAEESLKVGYFEAAFFGPSRRYELMTEPKKIAQNFRNYASCAHYWSAAIATGNPKLEEDERARRALHFAEEARRVLLMATDLDAKNWGMRPCSDGIVFTNVGGIGWASSTLELVQGYRNPNWGYLA